MVTSKHCGITLMGGGLRIHAQEQASPRNFFSRSHAVFHGYKKSCEGRPVYEAKQVLLHNYQGQRLLGQA